MSGDIQPALIEVKAHCSSDRFTENFLKVGGETTADNGTIRLLRRLGDLLVQFNQFRTKRVENFGNFGGLHTWLVVGQHGVVDFIFVTVTFGYLFNQTDYFFK